MFRTLKKTMVATHTKPGSAFFDFSLGDHLGRGASAEVYEATETATGRKFACKIIDKRKHSKPKQRKHIEDEIAIHSSMDHPHIVKLYRSFENYDEYHIVVELCQFNTVADLLKIRKQFTEREARKYMLQVLDAVEYMHEEKLVIHRDLKLANLFLDVTNGDVKIGDFGFAAQLTRRDERRKTICGTPNYMAPEILDGGGAGGYSFEVDIWSLGVMLYTILIGKAPFQTKEVSLTYRRIRWNSFSFPETIPISDKAKNLIRTLLQSDPGSRPSISDIRAHPFLANPTN